MNPELNATANHKVIFRGGAFLLAALLLLGVTACSGGGKIRGEAPFAQVTGWAIEGDQLRVDLRLRNVNDEDLQVNTLNVAVEVSDMDLFDYSSRQDKAVISHSFEIFSFTTSVSTEGMNQLLSLRDGDVNSLAYSITGHIDNPDHGRMDFEREGHIYNVPGRPGQFR